MNYSHITSANSLEQLMHDCQMHLKLRCRNKGQGTAYAFQCQFCGEFRGKEEPKRFHSQQPVAADLKLAELYQKKFQELNMANLKDLPLGDYAEEGKPIKSGVEEAEELQACIENFCQENGYNKDRLLKLFLYRQREAAINEYLTRWSRESDLHDWFSEVFAKWFDVYHEVPGYGYINGEKIPLKIDFLIKAKDELLECGFTNQFFGVEVKYLDPRSGKGFHKKSSEGVFQALSYWYSGARWSLTGVQNIELASVLFLSNLSFRDESDQVFETYDRLYDRTWRTYFSIANHANVGEIQIREWQGSLKSWRFDFNGAAYFSFRKSSGLKLGNPDVINKGRIGSQKLKTNELKRL